MSNITLRPFEKLSLVGYLFCLTLLSFIIVSCNLPTPTPSPLTVTPQPIPIFNDETGQPIQGDFVILCTESTTDTMPNKKFSMTTDSAGIPTNWDDSCRQIAALHLRTDLNAPDDYRIFSISWPANTPHLEPLSAEIIIDSKNLFVLFDPVVSLAWTPDAGSSILNQDSLRESFRKASSNLFDLTEGQMAFGNVQVYAEGEEWRNADFRFLAANDLRPSASIGGMVNESMIYPFPSPLPIRYVPGAIHLGRTWDSNDWRHTDRRWENDENARTLVHEWGHYALFLYDEYLGADSNGDPIEAACTCNTNDSSCSLNASAMYWHEEATELWNPTIHSNSMAACEQTFQWQFYGKSDWEILTEWFGIQGYNSSLTFVSPVSLPEDGAPFEFVKPLFDLSCNNCDNSATEPEATISADGTLFDSSDPTQVGTLLAQVYTLVDQEQDAPFDAVTQILYQGSEFLTPINEDGESVYQGQLRLLGVHEQGDDAAVFVDNYGNNEALKGQYYDTQTLASNPDPLFEVKKGDWAPTLDIEYEAETDPISMITELITVTAVLTETTDAISDKESVYGQLCVPDNGCTDPYEMKQESDVQFTLDLSAAINELGFTAMPLYSILRLYSPQVGEIIRTIQTGNGAGPGGGCPHGMAPTSDGNVTTYIRRTDENCGSVIAWMPAANQGALLLPDELPINRFVSVPIDVDIVYANSDTCSLETAEASFITQVYDDQTLCETAVLDALPHSDQNIETFLTQLYLEGNYYETLEGLLDEDFSDALVATIVCSGEDEPLRTDIIRAAENRLVTLHFNPNGDEPSWELLQSGGNDNVPTHPAARLRTSLDSDQNLLTASIEEDGIYVLGLATPEP